MYLKYCWSLVDACFDGFSVFLSSLPVKRILNKPQIFRGSPHTDVNAGHSRGEQSLLIKGQRSRHNHLYDISHQIRVRQFGLWCLWGLKMYTCKFKLYFFIFSLTAYICPKNRITTKPFDSICIYHIKMSFLEEKVFLNAKIYK